MSDAAEKQLIELVSREQRSTRAILLAGITTLVLVVAMSAALAVYYNFMANRATETSAELERVSGRLEKQAFDVRREVDRQKNLIAGQEAAIRRAYDEIRLSYAAASPPSDADLVQAVTDYLERGRHSLTSERLIESQPAETAPDDAPAALARGAAHLLGWLRSGRQIGKDAADLPDVLKDANAAFTAAAADPALRPLADTGLAWVMFIDAGSPRSEWATAKCEAVNAQVSKIANDDALALQPLYWRAQCNRKMGRTADALRDYSLALKKIDPASNDAFDADEMLLQMNAYHGLGTVLIATADLGGDPEVATARALAAQMCPPAANGEGSDLMKLTRACLGKAIDLRKALDQTENQQSGSGENISFTYLRDGNFAAALASTVAVERTGLFPWNELVRALAAAETGDAEIEEAARRNVSLFGVNQFNLCELKVLMTPETYDKALAILVAEHAEDHAKAPIGCK